MSQISCLDQVKKNNAVIPKVKWWAYILMQFSVYLFQCLIFLTTYVLTEHWDVGGLLKVIIEKISVSTLKEFGILFGATIFALGIISVVGRMFNGTADSPLLDEIMAEVPRVAYTFGASFSSLCLIVAFLSSGSNRQDYYQIAAMSFGLGFFIGCSLSFGLKKSTYIK